MHRRPTRSAAKDDLIRYQQRHHPLQDGGKINDFLQTGEMIQVGRAWQLVDAPIRRRSSATTPRSIRAAAAT